MWQLCKRTFRIHVCKDSVSPHIKYIEPSSSKKKNLKSLTTILYNPYEGITFEYVNFHKYEFYFHVNYKFKII